MVQDVPPIIVESAFVVKGGLLCKDSKVALTTVIVDDVKHNCFQIRKRDFWSYGPFIGRKGAATQKDRISSTVKLIGAKFRKAVLEKRKETVQKEQEAVDEELRAADSGRQELGISDSESDAAVIEDEDEIEDDEEADGDKEAKGSPKKAKEGQREGPVRGEAIARPMKGIGKVRFTEIEVEGQKFEVAENCHLNGILIRATTQSIEHVIQMFHTTITGLAAEQTSEVKGPGSEAKKLSWKQKKMKDKAGEEGAAADLQSSDTHVHMPVKEAVQDSGAAFNIRGLVGWRNSDKCFIIWYKKADGQRSQTQKGLLVKTTKKTGAGEVSLTRAEFMASKRKMFVNAVQKWNEWDCSKRPRLSVPCLDDE